MKPTTSRTARKDLSLSELRRFSQATFDAAKNVIEPRLAAIAGKAIPADAAGNGFILLRVANLSLVLTV